MITPHIQDALPDAADQRRRLVELLLGNNQLDPHAAERALAQATVADLPTQRLSLATFADNLARNHHVDSKAIGAALAELERLDRSQSPNHFPALSAYEPPRPFDLLLIAARHRWKLVLLPLLAGLVALVICLIYPHYYVAHVRLLPPNLFNSALRFNPDSNAIGNVAEQFTIRNQSELFAALLQSPKVLDSVLRAATVTEIYGKGDAQVARNVLQAHTSVAANRDGAVDILITERDPQRSAVLANAYAPALEARIRELANDESDKRRATQQARKAALEKDLAKAEAVLVRTQERTGLVDVANQGYHYYNYLGDARQKLAFKESQMAALQAYATPYHPAVVRLQSELSALRTQVATMAKMTPDKSTNGVMAKGEAPEDILSVQQAQRDVKTLETQLQDINHQLSLTSMETSASNFAVQVAEPATTPTRPAGPRVVAIPTFVTVLAFLLVLLAVSFREYWYWLSQQPQYQGRFVLLRSMTQRKSGVSQSVKR